MGPVVPLLLPPRINTTGVTLGRRSEELVKRDGKGADAPARRVEYCVGNGRGDADERDLAHALDSKRVHRVRLADEDNLYVGHVRVYGHQVVPEGGVGDSPGP